MKKLKLFLVSAILLVCSHGMLYAEGEKEKNVNENEQQILEYAAELGLKTDNIYAIKNKQACKPILQQEGVPHGLLFSSDKTQIEYLKNNSRVNTQLIKVLKRIRPNGHFTVDANSSLSTSLRDYCTLQGAALKELPEADYYLVVYWSIWTKELNEKFLLQIENAALNNPSCKICVLKVNVDHQDFWEHETLDEPIQHKPRQ